jgi:hypothetical protein
MQPLRLFSIIIAILIIIASSSNTSFKPGNEVNDGINTKAPLIDSILLLSIDDKPISYSLLQTISAEEQVQQEVDQEEDRKDSDSVMEREEEEDRGQSESESSIGQEQEQQDSEEEYTEDGIKENCRHEEHFDSGIDSCIPDEEKVCDDDIDNDNDGKVDLEDLDCLPNNKDDQVQQQNNKEERGDKEKLPRKEEPSLDYVKDNNDSENPGSTEEKNNNNTSSSDGYITESEAQNNSQNLTNSHSTTTNKNNASFNRSHHYANCSAPEDSFTLNCDPAETIVVPGAEGSITCTIGNISPNPIDLMIGCSGLEGTGIECSINGEHSTRTTLAKEMSNTNFSVSMVSASSPAVPPGSYPFTISAEVCINSDLC